MGRSRQLLAIAITGAVAFAGGAAYATAKAREVVKPFASMQFREVGPGVSKALLWGDEATGRYATLTRFAAGTRNPLHTHPYDVQLVVIRGAFIYGTEAKRTALGPGSYVLVPAGYPHTGDSDEETIFLEQSIGR